jgi:O-antigen ligase
MPVDTKSPTRERAAFILLLFLLAACFLFGGASRADAQSQFVPRIAAVIVGSVSLLWIGGENFARIKVPFLILSGFGLLILVQLIPLPPSIWSSLANREQFVPLADMAQISQPWRPISLDPDATINSLMSTVSPLAMLLCFSLVSKERYLALLAAIGIGTTMSGLIAAAQIGSGGTALYYYDITNVGSGVGVFANRNHQAVLLTATIPILAGMARGRYKNSARPVIILSCAALVMVPLIFITGSRAGIALLLAASVGSYFILRKAGGLPGGRLQRKWWKDPYLGAIALLIAVGALMAFLRVGAVGRFISDDMADDPRRALLGSVWGLVWQYFPLGAGFGTFPKIFKVVEPDWHLNLLYYNHAHNDVLEAIIEGGAIAAALGVAGFAWWSLAAWKVWKAPFPPQGARTHLLGLVGSAIVPLVLLASLVDYPLRTPLLASLFALAMGFLSAGVRDIRNRAHPRRAWNAQDA